MSPGRDRSGRGAADDDGKSGVGVEQQDTLLGGNLDCRALRKRSEGNPGNGLAAELCLNVGPSTTAGR